MSSRVLGVLPIHTFVVNVVFGESGYIFSVRYSEQSNSRREMV